MSPIITRLAVVAASAMILLPFSARAQDPAPPKKDTVTQQQQQKPDSAAPKTDSTEAVDKSLLTGFYEIMPGRGLTITLEKNELYGAPSSGEKKKLIYQSGLTFAVEGTKMTLTFIPDADGRATDLVMQQNNGQTRMLKKTR